MRILTELKANIMDIKTALDGLTVKEQIDLIVKENFSRGDIEVACFWSLGVFTFFKFPEIVRKRFGKHHDKFFNAIPRGARGKKVNIIAPRGSAKSTILAVIYPLHCIVYKEFYESIGVTSDRFILIVSRNYSTAADRVHDIRNYIEQEYPDLKGERWGMDATETANGVRLMAQGRGGKIRGALHKGWRPTLVVADDIDDFEALMNPNNVAKDIRWWNSDLMQCGDEYTNFINVDTVKSSDAISMRLKASPSWETIFIRAIEEPKKLIHPIHENLWKDYRKIFIDKSIEPLQRVQKLDDFYRKHEKQMTQGVVETWPEKWPYRALREKAFDEGIANVLREYQNFPEDRSLAIFNMDEAIRFDVTEDGFLRSDGRLVGWGELSGATVFLDWAGANAKKLENAFAAVVTIVWEPVPTGGYQDDYGTGNAYGYVFSDWLDRGNRQMQLEALLDEYISIQSFLSTRVRNPEFHICCEGLVDKHGDMQENFDRHYHAVSIAKKVTEPLQFVARTKNKNNRIEALEAPIQNGWLAFNRELSEELWDQFCAFPVGKYLDAPDAAEGAWAQQITQTAADAEVYNRKIDYLAAASKNAAYHAVHG